MPQAAAQQQNPSFKLSVGDKAPDFSMPTDGGRKISLSGLKGKNVLLYFYPKDDTPGCTVEAKDFRDRMMDFMQVDTIVLGVSKDSVKSHDKFKEKHGLTFDLASDEAGSMCEDYGVWVEKSMYGKTYMGIERTTVLIDKKGKILKIWNKVKVEGHADECLETARNL